MSDSEHTTISGPYLDQLVEEAVGRWVAMCKPILGNWSPQAARPMLASGQAWPWNEGLSHNAFIQREFWRAMERDRRRDAEALVPNLDNWSA